MTLAQEESVITEDTQVGDWLVRCVSSDDISRSCFMVTNAINALQQRELAIIQIVRVEAEDRQGEEEFAVQLTSPTNVNVRAGIEMRVDQDLAATIPYEVCTVNNCITTFPLDPQIASSLVDGFAAVLIFVNAAGTPISASFSLDGFPRALELL